MKEQNFKSVLGKDSIFAVPELNTLLPSLGHLFPSPCPPTHLTTPKEGLGILSVNDQSLLSIAQGCGGSLQL